MTTLLITVAGVYVVLLILKGILAHAYARRLTTEPPPPLAPGTLTIAQPILSGDPHLESKLEASLLALSGQTFVWLVDTDDAEGQRIVEGLQSKHSGVRIHIERCTPCPDGINPKLWKLQRAAAITQTPFFCVLDDDTLLPPDTAAALVAAAKAGSTVATGLPCYLDSGDVPSALLAQFVNNNSAFTYLGTSCLLPPITLNGMGYLMSLDTLSKLGNFEPILRELTDDLAVATLVLSQGGTIHQSAAPLRVQTGVRDMWHYFQLMHRWYLFSLLLLRRQGIWVQTVIMVLHGLPPLLFGLLVVLSAWVDNASCVIVVMGLRLVVIRAVQRRYFGASSHRPLLSIVSELLQPVHLVHAAVCRTIRWRTRHYRVRDTNDFSAA